MSRARLPSEIPFLGSGLGYRLAIKDQILAARNEIDFVEIIAEQYAQNPLLWDELEEIGEIFQVIPHGIEMSIGSCSPIDRSHLSAVRRISEMTNSPYYSEHLCVRRVPGIDIGHLSPLWFSEEVLQSTVEKVKFAQDFLQKPLALENVTYSFDIPGAAMTQGEFFQRLVDATDCLVLLDVTNVYINSINHGYSAVEFLDQMPLDRVVQIHLSGGFWKDGMLIDGHCEDIEQGIWDLLKDLAKRNHSIRGSILERDSKFPDDFRELLDSLQMARDILGWGR